MDRRSLIGILALAGCATQSPKPDGVSPSLAARKRHELTVQLIDEPHAPAFYKVRSADGREWRIPTAGYQPDKVGVDGVPMKEYVEVYQRISRAREIVGFREGADLKSKRLLFIKGTEARLCSLVHAERDLAKFPLHSLLFADWSLDEIRDDGIVMQGTFFKWDLLKVQWLGTFPAIDTLVAPTAS